LLVCGIAVQLFRSFEGARSAAQSVERTYHILNTADSLLFAIKDAQDGQRGYLLTRDEVFMQRYHSAIAKEQPLCGRLAQLVAGNPVQAARVQEIERIARRRLELLAQILQADRNSDHAAALALLRTGEGQRLMDALGDVVHRLESEEEHSQAQFGAVARDRQASLKWTFLAGFVFLLVLLAVAGVSTDRFIRVLQRAERRLRESEERLRRVLDNVPDVIVLYDRQRRIQYINSATTAITGMAPADFLGRREEDIWPPEISAQVVELLETAIQTKTPQDREVDLLLPATGQRHLLSRVVPLLDEAGAVRELVGITHDLTEWKQAQETLRRRAEHELNILQSMVAATPVGLLMLDRNLRQVQCSQRWLDDLGLTRDKVIGRLHYETFPVLPEIWKDAHRRGLSGESLGARDQSFTAPDGTVHWVNWQIRPWGDQGETTGGIIIFSEDFTAHRRIESAARESELRYRGLFEHMHEGLAYCEMIFEDGQPRDFIYLAVNASFGLLTGLQDVVGKRVSQAIPGILESDPELIRTYGRVASTRIPEAIEVWVEALQMWFSISLYSPEQSRFIAIFDVITERKRAELAAREWRRAFEQTEIGIALVEPVSDTFTAVNATFARERGYLPEELIGQSIAVVNPPERLELMKQIVVQANAESGHAAAEWTHLRKDGSRFPVYLDLTGVRDEEGRLISRVVIAQDLTERKRAEQERHRSDELYRAIVRNLPGTGVFVVDRDLRYVAVEGDLPARIGFARENLVGRTVREVLEASLAAASEQRFHLTLDGGTVNVEGEFQQCPIWTRYAPLHDASGGVFAALALSTDISAQKRAEREILRLNEDLELRVRNRTVQLEAAVKELEAFSYSVSHDLRSPLRGIDGWSLAMLEDFGASLNDTAKGYLSRVRSETQRMGLLIDDMLLLSRVTRSEMKRGTVDLSALAHGIAGRLQEEQPGRRLEFQIQDGLSALGDARLLEVALTNLLGNAVKFTGPRAVARIEFGQAETHGERTFFVRDNGVGFNMDYASNLFGAFQRLHSASEFPGTGIGLATVQRVVRRHGGRAWAESVVGEGARFYFTLGADQ